MWIMYYVDYALMSLLRPLNLFITWLFCPDRLAGSPLKNGSLPKIDFFDVSDDFEQDFLKLKKYMYILEDSQKLPRRVRASISRNCGR